MSSQVMFQFEPHPTNGANEASPSVSLHVKGQTLTTQTAFSADPAAIIHEMAVMLTHMSLALLLTDKTLGAVRALPAFGCWE